MEESKVIQSDSVQHTLREIEKILRQQVKTKTLTEEAFAYMALIINEDSPKNAAELISLIGDFLTDGMACTDEEAFKTCETLIRTFLEATLLNVEHRDTITAEKLSNPVIINEIKQTGHSGVIREEEFTDPFLDAEKKEGNYNTFEGKPWELKKKKKNKEEERQRDALDKKIEEFVAHKRRIPPPTVIHDKGDGFKQDIQINAITLIAGGKTLLEGA